MEISDVEGMDGINDLGPVRMTPFYHKVKEMRKKKDKVKTNKEIDQYDRICYI